MKETTTPETATMTFGFKLTTRQLEELNRALCDLGYATQQDGVLTVEAWNDVADDGPLSVMETLAYRLGCEIELADEYSGFYPSDRDEEERAMFNYGKRLRTIAAKFGAAL
jgi:hypothetical protein